MTVSSPLRATAPLIGSLALLTAVSPLATDMYLPAFPEVATDLGTSASGVQFTLTAFMIGLGAGQLMIGPLSDSIGRRRPLLAGTMLCLLASIACALAPNIVALVAARFVQGMAGAAGVVIARAVITDVTTGASTTKLMNVMMIIGGLMPVIAPPVGGGILQLVDWRGVFWVIAALVVVMIAAVVFVIGESLPPAKRHPGGVRTLWVNIRTVVRNRTYVAATLVFGFGFATLFAYISASPFVIQDVLGLPTLAFSILFGVNSLGMTVASTISIRLAGRVEVRKTLGVGLASLLAATVSLFVVVFSGVPTVPVLVLMFCVTFSMGLIMGNASAIAMRAVATTAGTGSAFMGAFQFLLGAGVSPLVGLAGASDARPMVIVMLISVVIASLAYLLGVARQSMRPAGAAE